MKSKIRPKKSSIAAIVHTSKQLFPRCTTCSSRRSKNLAKLKRHCIPKELALPIITLARRHVPTTTTSCNSSTSPSPITSERSRRLPTFPDVTGMTDWTPYPGRRRIDRSIGTSHDTSSNCAAVGGVLLTTPDDNEWSMKRDDRDRIMMSVLRTQAALLVCQGKIEALTEQVEEMRHNGKNTVIAGA